MMLFVTLLSFGIICVSCDRVRNECIYPKSDRNQADYYWRDYLGDVPADAVPGGYSEVGNVTYIGQLPSPKHPGTFIGSIYPGSKNAVASIGGKVLEGDYVKILCSNPSNKFEWISTTADDSHLLVDYHWVRGGAQQAQVSYVARANVDGQVQVGRAFESTSPYKGLWIYKNDGTERTLKSFELLVLPR